MSDTAIVSTENDPRPPAVICRERGWGPGTLLAGDEGYGVTVIEIVCVHDHQLHARQVAHAGYAVNGDESSWVLFCRDWRPIDRADVPQPLRVGLPVRSTQGIFGEIESGPDRYGAYIVSAGDRKWSIPAKHLRVQENGSDRPGSGR